jgi:4-hydroxy-tetrahydrodipicolinate synthase
MCAGQWAPQGIIASLVSNFTRENAVDEAAIQQNAEYLVAAGVNGVCVAGGTGEAIGLSQDEYRRVVDAAIRGANGQAHVIAGALYVDPSRIIDCCRYAKSAGASAAMLIAPYFLRPSAGEIQAHFDSIADAVDIPLILFNSPGRSGADLDADMLLNLARSHQNVVALKDSSANLTKLADIISEAPHGFSVLQGLDDLVLATLAIGGSGTISALATAAPRLFIRMYEEALAGDYENARSLQFKVLSYSRAVYRETNPVGLKRLLELLGRPGGFARPPLQAIAQEDGSWLRETAESVRILEHELALETSQPRS